MVSNFSNGGDDLSRNEKFLGKLKQIIESNLDNEQFGVKDLAESIGLSRIQVYRKLHQLTGKNISQYIRETRLEKAMELLKKDVANVSEIAYQVGFSSPAYFNKCFHEFYGYPPGEINKKNHNSNKDPDENSSVPTVNDESNLLDQKQNARIFSGRLYRISAFTFILIFVVAALYYFFWLNPKGPSKTEFEKTIAVMPIHNESNIQENTYFCNAMQAEILTQLQKTGNMVVRPGQSAMQYRNSDKDIPTIGRELKAAYILDGSAWKSGDSVRLQIKLINSKTNQQLWGESYDMSYTSGKLFKNQTDIAKLISASLDSIIMPLKKKMIVSHHVTSVEAYILYIKGINELSAYYEHWDTANSNAALKLFNQALAIDPEFAEALAEKGEVFLWAKNDFDSAIYYCRKAISLDQESGLDYAALGDCYYSEGLFDYAIKYYLKAIELVPDFHPYLFVRLGMIDIKQYSDLTKGMFYLEKSLNLSVRPRAEDYFGIAECFHYVGDYDKAYEYAIKGIQAGHSCEAQQWFSWLLILYKKPAETFEYITSLCDSSGCENDCNLMFGDYYFFQYDYIKAEKYYNQIINPNFLQEPATRLAYIYKKTGRSEKARSLLYKSISDYKELNMTLQKRWYYLMNQATVYAIVDEKEEALKFLSDAINTKFSNNWVDYAQMWPPFENLREEPEFRTIINRSRKEKESMREQIRELEEKGQLDL